MKRLTLLLIILINICIFAEDKEMGSKYFRIIYDENYEEEATKLAQEGDLIADKQFKFFDFIPPEKLVIVLKDKTDEENAYAVDNTILLYPNSINTFEMEKTYDDWYVYAFTHELTHVIINRKVGGVFDAIPLFKYNLHQLFIPSWYHEGLAIYSEVKFNEDRKSGRELSKKFEMHIKDDLFERKFEGLAFANGYYFNQDNYSHGYAFIKFFVDIYGEEALQQVIEEVSNHQIMQPFEAFLDIAGVKTEEEMFRLWSNYLNEKYIVKTKLREGTPLSNISKGTKTNLLVRDGELYYSNYYESLEEDEESEGIFKYNLNTNEETEIVDSLPVNGFDVFDKNLYYSTLFFDYRDSTSFAEPYKIEKKEKGYSKPKHLDADRVVNMVYLDDEFAYVYRDKEELGLRTQSGKLLIAPNEGYLFQKFFYDELNQFIYFAATKVDEKVSWIYEFNMETYEITKIVQGYSPFIEGDNLYFDNSKDGVFNIFKYNFITEDITQLTKVNLGAFEPQVLNNELYFLNYKDNNFSLNKLSPDIYYDKNVLAKDFDEQEPIVMEEKVQIERTFDVENLRRRRFKNNYSYRYGYLVPGQVVLTYSDQLWENFITVGVSDYLHGGSSEESGTAIYYGDESYDENAGIIAQYENSLMRVSAELSRENYIEFEYNLPILGRDYNSWFFGEVQLNTESERTFGAYMNKDFLFLSKYDTLGFRVTMDNEEDYLNEFYYEGDLLSLRLFYSAAERQINGTLNEDFFIPLDSFSVHQLRYNVYSNILFIADTELGKVYPVNKGNISGTTSIMNYMTSVKMYVVTIDADYNRFVYDASVGGNGFVFTHWPISLSTGLLGQINLNEFAFVEDTSKLYIKYKLEF